MHALDVLGDPVRRRILELLADDGELGAGEIGEIVRQEFGISQPAVSQHLRVLREHGFATVRAEGRRRLYAVDPRGPREARDWLTPFERFWLPKLDALGTELARGKRQRRLAAGGLDPVGRSDPPPSAAAPAVPTDPTAPTDPAAGSPPVATAPPTPKET
jgi:DNA-binding transcriptional ArsR family regulator